MQRLLRRFESIYCERGSLSDNTMALMLLLALTAALCTEWLGIHLLFGSFDNPLETLFAHRMLGLLAISVRP